MKSFLQIKAHVHRAVTFLHQKSKPLFLALSESFSVLSKIFMINSFHFYFFLSFWIVRFGVFGLLLQSFLAKPSPTVVKNLCVWGLQGDEFEL